MASRPILTPFPVITDGDMTTTITSEVSIIQNTSRISYDINWTGTAPVGTIFAQASNTYALNAAGQVSEAGDWISIPLSVVPAVSGDTGTGFIDIQGIAAYAVRIQYVPTSGSGVLNATITGKVN
jgi:hypothetical protein